MSQNGRRVAIFVSFSGQGGVERAMNLLSLGLLNNGAAVDLILPRAAGEHLESIPEGVNVIRFKTRHTFSALFPLAGYLRRERPDALLAAKHRAIVTAVLASRLAGFKGMVAGNIQTTISAGLKESSALKRAVYFGMMRFFYRWTNLIIGVSIGVAEDIIQITGLPREKVTVIYNPVVTPEMSKLALEPAGHPWFSEEGIPVILGIGRLTRQKDFHTLVRAFAQVSKARRTRLIILGDGDDLSSLEKLARELGVRDDVYFAGFQKNPYAWLARSSLFVLSSRWEGFGIVVAESLALGIPVVSTDCPNGPREILKDGRFGPLVPVEDHKALAEAMIKTLDDPLSSEKLKSAAQGYTVNGIGKEYLERLIP